MSVAVANLAARAFVAVPYGVGIQFDQLFEKKFQSSGWPSVLYIATRLAESL